MQASFLTAVILPLALAIIMLGMGLSLLPEDFLRVTKYPKAVAIGLISQLIFYLLLALLLLKLYPWNQRSPWD